MCPKAGQGRPSPAGIKESGKATFPGEDPFLIRTCLLLSLMCLLLGAPGAALHAQTAGAAAAAPASPAAQRQRLALVIGIGTLGPRVMLESARRDSQAVAAALRAGGFEVLLREDAGADQLRAAFKEFRSRLRPESTGLIYFTGLAAQADGRNLLLPADMTLNESLSAPALATVLRAAGVSLQEALDALAGATDSARLLLVDAAYRQAPLDRLTPPGLARPRLPAGVMVLLGHAPAALQDLPLIEPLPPAFKASPTSARADWSAGSRPAASPVSKAAKTEMPRAVGLSEISSTRGNHPLEKLERSASSPH